MKEYILENFQEEIFEHFLGLKVRLKTAYKSPFRGDRKPDCYFFRKNGKLKFIDFAERESYDCFDVVKKQYNCDFNTAMNIIQSELEIEDVAVKESIKKKWENKLSDTESYDFSYIGKPINAFETAYFDGLFIDKEVRESYNYKVAKAFFIGEKKVFTFDESNPIFVYDSPVGIQMYRPYSINKENKFRSKFEPNVLLGKEALTSQRDLLIITKSVKDMMVLRAFGYDALSVQSESEILNLDGLQYNRIILLFDNDKTGIKAANKAKKEHPAIELVFIPIGEGKDISEYVTWLRKEKQEEKKEIKERLKQLFHT